jgi:hypothetical protein
VAGLLGVEPHGEEEVAWLLGGHSSQSIRLQGFFFDAVSQLLVRQS